MLRVVEALPHERHDPQLCRGDDLPERVVLEQPLRGLGQPDAAQDGRLDLREPVRAQR